MNPRAKRILIRVLIYILLCIHLVVICYPLYLMGITALKPIQEIYVNPLGLPRGLNFTNFQSLFHRARYDLFFRNSIIVTGGSLVFSTAIAALAAYAIAKFRFRINSIVYFYLISGIMVPIRLGTVSILRMMNAIHLVDNLLSLLILYTTMGLPFAVLVLTGFIREIPEDLSQSARIDGCNEYGIFWRIIVPLLTPGISSTVVINIIPTWNEFWFALMLIKSQTLKTIPLAVAILFGQFQTDWGKVMAVLAMAAAPPVILYLAFSRQIIKGFAQGAFKG